MKRKILKMAVVCGLCLLLSCLFAVNSFAAVSVTYTTQSTHYRTYENGTACYYTDYTWADVERILALYPDFEDRLITVARLEAAADPEFKSFYLQYNQNMTMANGTKIVHDVRTVGDFSVQANGNTYTEDKYMYNTITGAFVAQQSWFKCQPKSRNGILVVDPTDECTITRTV